MTRKGPKNGASARNQKGPNQNNGKKKKRNGRRRRAPRQLIRLSPLTDMVANPCSAPLTEGLYGDSVGFLSRFKNVTTLNVEPNGYIAWFPDMAQGLTFFGEANSGSSCFMFETADSSRIPVNSGPDSRWGLNASPFGTTARTYRVAGDQFTESNVCASQRTVSACIKMRYTGRMDATSGEVALLTGVSIAQLLGESNYEGGNTEPLSVDDVFQLSSDVTRLSLDGHEVRHRPNSGSEHLKPSPAGQIMASTGAALEVGALNSSITARTSTAAAHDPRAIILAWRGLPAAAPLAPLVFETHLGLEWTPNASQGLSAPRTIEMGPKDTYSTVLRSLDRMGQVAWETMSPHIERSARSVVAGMAQAGMTYMRGQGNLLRQ